MLDVGTGSGAVALALKDERPNLAVWGSDDSEEALELARANGRRLGLSVRWLRADLLDGVPDTFDAVLANLPYVAEGERSALAPEITRHEPARALFAARTGSTRSRRCSRSSSIAGACAWWRSRSARDMRPSVAGLVGSAGFQRVQCLRDLAGLDRVVTGHREGR